MSSKQLCWKCWISSKLLCFRHFSLGHQGRNIWGVNLHSGVWLAFESSQREPSRIHLRAEGAPLQEFLIKRRTAGVRWRVLGSGSSLGFVIYIPLRHLPLLVIIRTLTYEREVQSSILLPETSVLLRCLIGLPATIYSCLNECVHVRSVHYLPAHTPNDASFCFITKWENLHITN